MKMMHGDKVRGKAVEIARITLKESAIFPEVLSVSYRWRHWLNQLPLTAGRRLKVVSLKHTQFASYLEASHARLPINQHERRERRWRWAQTLFFLAAASGVGWIIWESIWAFASF
jgi:hypothetical protein